MVSPAMLKSKNKRASIRHQVMDRQMMAALQSPEGRTPDPKAGFTPRKMSSVGE